MELESGSSSVKGCRSRSRRRASGGGPHSFRRAYGCRAGCDGLRPGLEAHVGWHV